jgi:hypothetical protein
MIMRTHRSVASALLATVCVAAPVAAGAQVSVGVAGGATFTTNGVAGAYRAGGSLQGAVWRPLGRSPVTLRADLSSHWLARTPLGTQRHERGAFYAGLVGAEVRLGPAAWRLQPYGTAAVGAMSTELGGGREAHLAYTAGAGLRGSLGALTPYLEVRRVRAQDGSRMSLVPVSLGVRF